MCSQKQCNPPRYSLKRQIRKAKIYLLNLVYFSLLMEIFYIILKHPFTFLILSLFFLLLKFFIVLVFFQKRFFVLLQLVINKFILQNPFYTGKSRTCMIISCFYTKIYEWPLFRPPFEKVLISKLFQLNLLQNTQNIVSIFYLTILILTCFRAY